MRVYKRTATRKYLYNIVDHVADHRNPIFTSGGSEMRVLLNRLEFFQVHLYTYILSVASDGGTRQALLERQALYVDQAHAV